jgi:hypothetical protein
MVEVIGNGVVSPNLKTYKNGTKYTFTAIPHLGSVFANWLTNGVVATISPTYAVVAESNLLLQAVFVTNPFTGVSGAYDGLFYDTNSVTEDSSGSFASTVTSLGAYSGKIMIGASVYPISGQFSVSGVASKSILRPAQTPLSVQLQLNMSNGPITGTVSDGTWTANLQASPAIYSTHLHAPQAGRYTLLIPGSTSSETLPGGNGFGTVTVSEYGNVTMTGTLGDGTPVVSTGMVCSQGLWPMYIPLYAGKGSILGWLSFTNRGDIDGQIAWFKLPQKTAKFYPGGFTNTTEIIGSVFEYTKGLPILGFANGLLSLVNGNLTESMTNQLSLGLYIPGMTQSATILKFNTLTGGFGCTVTNAATGKLVPINGVVLQNQNFAAGFFAGTNQTGSAVLSPLP